MIKRASFSDLAPGVKLLVHPTPDCAVREELIGLVFKVSAFDDVIVQFTNEVWTHIPDVPSTYILYDELTEREKFIMTLKGDIIDNCENGGTVDTLL